MTTSEIAKKLGISRGTVSRVLNNHPNVKPETRKRVLEALKELNYIPNETARSLVMQKEFHIAVIVFSQPAFFWAQVQSGVSTAQNDLASQGVIVDYFVTDMMKPEEQLELIRTLRIIPSCWQARSTGFPAADSRLSSSTWRSPQPISFAISVVTIFNQASLQGNYFPGFFRTARICSC